MTVHKRSRGFRALALLLAVMTLFSVFPLTASAAQENGYHDPADRWLPSNNRTNELDANAVVTHETFLCYSCDRYTGFTVWRTPEYARGGVTAMSRNVKYSDGTCVDGKTAGVILDGIPGRDAQYTGSHWTKACCDTCGTLNANMDPRRYCYSKDVYWLYDCAAEFTQNLPETAAYAYEDGAYHRKSTTSGTYCGFCYGTRKTTASTLERHDLERTVVPQLANQRFVVKDLCTLCGYERSEYVGAKAVVADYYGVVDGQPHTLTVSDLSESGVNARIRYGNSADSCNLTTAPAYTDEGQYTVYYEITYTCQGADMTENGVAYVWLRDEAPDENGADCPCGCGKPDCGCKKDQNCGGSCNSCGNDHNFTKLETVSASCLGLGYARYLCADCGKVEKRDYTAALGHAWQSIVIREATCETDGKVLETCRRCGETNVVNTPKGEHRYETYSTAATCTMPGHTVRECAVCGDRHITDITAALPHKYQAQTIPAGCESGGRTIHQCEGCGSSFVTDYTAPLGHSWDEGRPVTVPTCTGEGVTEYRCVRCGFHRLEASAAEGHTPGPAADCEHAQLCTQCGAVLQDALGHSITETVTAATCEDMGYTAYTCESCGLSYKTDYLQALGHDYAAAVTAPACTVGGFTTHTCTRCGDSYTDTPTEALGHDWDAGTRLTSPTCNTEGLLEHHCTRCDASYLEALSPAGHRESGWIMDKEPTAFDGGHRHKECEDCGAVLEQETLDKLGNTGDTDGRGETEVGGYLVIVTDTHTGNPVADAHVVLNRDETFSIRLPHRRLLDSEKRTTVTVLLKKDRAPLPGLGVTVTDREGNRSAGRTNARGQLTVPAASGSTGGNITVGGKDENDEKLTLTVKVSDYESGRTIGDAVVTISKSGHVTVKLPRREKMDADNRILVTVTDHRKRPQASIDVTVKDSQGQSAGGETDEDGKLVVPAGRARHSAYIVGYPDGTFGPGRTMTRAEAAAIFARLLAEKKEEKIPAAAYTPFRDVPFASWYSGYVQYLGGYGIVTGRSASAFVPDAAISRAEFTAMAVRFLAAYGSEAGATVSFRGFYDVAASDWAASYIQEAALHGWVIGYGDGTFRGDAPISRAEAVTLVNRLLAREADEAYVEKNLRSLYTFVDLGKHHWAYWAVMEAANAHTAKSSDPETWSK